MPFIQAAELNPLGGFWVLSLDSNQQTNENKTKRTKNYHLDDSTHRLELPVSNTTVNVCLGDPIPISA